MIVLVSVIACIHFEFGVSSPVLDTRGSHTLTTGGPAGEGKRFAKAAAVAADAKPKTAVFWHVANSDSVVMDALQEMKTYALPYADVVHFSVHPPTSPEMVAAIRKSEKFQEVPLDADKFPAKATRSYYEFPTLSALHEYCAAHPADFVAYVHTKTNGHSRRDMLQKVFPLGFPPLDNTKANSTGAGVPEPIKNSCLGELKRGRNACGVNPQREMTNEYRYHGTWKPASWCHFSGNFWWARCDYVNTLNHPWNADASQELILEHPSGFGGLGRPGSPGNHVHRDSRAWGRYFCEWWLLNDVKLDVITNMSSPARDADAIKRWSHGYEPDAAGVWHRAHLVPMAAASKCSIHGNEAFEQQGCVTPAAKRLAETFGRADIWEWPATCPGDLQHNSYWDAFAAAEKAGTSCGRARHNIKVACADPLRL